MRESQPCPRELLAGGDLAAVERCSCGTLHLSMGGLTLRLQPDALRQLAATLAEALEALSTPEAERCAALPQGLLGASVRGAS